MSATATTRNAELLRARAAGASQRDLARRFRLSQPRVAQLLAQGTGDPLLLSHLAEAGERELARARARLEERIGGLLVTLVAVMDEQEVRRIDRILGLPRRP